MLFIFCGKGGNLHNSELQPGEEGAAAVLLDLAGDVVRKTVPLLEIVVWLQSGQEGSTQLFC